MFYEVTPLRGRPFGTLGAACAPQYLDGDCVMCCNPPATTTTTTASRTATMERNWQVSCANMYTTWARANPTLAACMNATDKQAWINVCLKIYRGQLASSARVGKIAEITKAACARSVCDAAMASHLRSNQALLQCTTGDQRMVARRACIADQIAGRSGTRKITALACPRPPPTVAPPPPPPPVVRPPPPAAPPPANVAPPVAVPPVATTPPDITGSGDTTPAQLSQPTPSSPLRLWGPIVGVLLVVGTGVYLLR